MNNDTPRVENYLLNFNSQFVPAELARNLERELTKKTNEVKRLRELLERLCDSVSENWDEGIANYFREEANK